MRITSLSIQNFRCFDNFSIDLSGKSRFLIGENAIGKSSLISAIARAMARERGFQRSDFLDLNRLIEIQVTLTDLIMMLKRAPSSTLSILAELHH